MSDVPLIPGKLYYILSREDHYIVRRDNVLPKMWRPFGTTGSAEYKKIQETSVAMFITTGDLSSTIKSIKGTWEFKLPDPPKNIPILLWDNLFVAIPHYCLALAKVS